MQKEHIKECKNKIKTERCILCGCDTGVPITQPVDSRKHYVYGCGQLCEVCSVSLKHELTSK